jgi:transposase
MNLPAELARLDLDPGLADWIAATVEQAQRQATQASAEAAKLSEQLTRRDTELHAAQVKIQALTLELAHLRRMRFGVKSEALSGEQRELFHETLASDMAAAQAELAREQAGMPSSQPAPRARAGRQALPEHLPRIEHRHEPDRCTCGHCGQDMVKIGEDITEQLDVEPARFFVHRHIRPQYACRACETVSAAPIPPAIIDGGMAAVGLYVWVIIGKYLDHLPLYRLEGIAQRQDVALSRSTLAEWVGRIGVALDPLADRLAELLRARAVLHADETPVRQLDPGAGKTKRAYLWVYRSNVLETGPPIVVFDYQPSRSGAHAREFLAGWRGHLMVDDYRGDVAAEDMWSWALRGPEIRGMRSAGRAHNSGRRYALQLPHEVHHRRHVLTLPRGAWDSRDIDACQCLGLHFEVHLGVDIGGVQRDVPEPGPDRVDIDTGSEQMDSGRVSQRVRTDALAAHRLDPCRRLRSTCGDDPVHPEPRHRSACTSAEDMVIRTAGSQQWPKRIEGLRPQWADPPLVALAENPYSGRCANLQAAYAKRGSLSGSGAAVVEKQQQRVVPCPLSGTPIGSPQERFDFMLVEIPDHRFCRLLERYRADLRAPRQMLGGAHPDKAGQRADAGQALVAGENGASTRVFNVCEEILHPFCRHLLDCQSVDVDCSAAADER